MDYVEDTENMRLPKQNSKSKFLNNYRWDTPNDLKKTENISLHRQTFAAQHGSFFRSEGKC